MNRIFKRFIYCLIFSLLFLSFTEYNCMAKSKSPKVKKPTVVPYETQDGFILKGKFQYPKNSSDKKVKYPLIIMLHSLGYSSSDWGNLPSLLKDQGFAVLSIDLRGHGLSIYNANFKARTWQYLAKSDFLKYPEDIYEYLDYFFNKSKYQKLINKDKIIFIGSDIGANTSILSTEKLKIKPKAFVLISPSLNFKNLYIPITLANLGNVPILGIASVKDRYSLDGLKEVKKYAQGNYDIKICPYGPIGMTILKYNPDLNNQIIKWCNLHK